MCNLKNIRIKEKIMSNYTNLRVEIENLKKEIASIKAIQVILINNSSSSYISENKPIFA